MFLNFSDFLYLHLHLCYFEVEIEDVCNIKFTNKSFSPHPNIQIPDLKAWLERYTKKSVVILPLNTNTYVYIFPIRPTNVHTQSHSLPHGSSKIHVSGKVGNVCMESVPVRPTIYTCIHLHICSLFVWRLSKIQRIWASNTSTRLKVHDCPSSQGLNRATQAPAESRVSLCFLAKAQAFLVLENKCERANITYTSTNVTWNTFCMQVCVVVYIIRCIRVLKSCFKIRVNCQYTWDLRWISYAHASMPFLPFVC